MRIVVALVVFVAIGLAVMWDGWREPSPARSGPEAVAEADAPSRGPGAAVAARRREVEPVSREGGVLVRVVDEAGEPVGGAEVRHSLLEPRAGDGPPDAALWTHDRPAAVARSGDVLRADARGEVVIPVPDSVTDSTEGGMYVCALDAGRLGEAWVLWREARGKEITLRLELDRGFVVQLLDHDGRPVPGVELEARHAQVDEIVGLRDHTRGLGTTDDDGLVLVRHVQTWWDGVHAPDGVRRVVVGPQLPGLGDVGTEIVLHDPMPERTVVRLPGTGRIRVIVEGAPTRDDRGHVVELCAIDAAGQVAERRPTSDQVDAQGEVVFERVALGQSWKLWLRPGRRATIVPGPTVAGEEVVHHFAAPKQPFLVGRLMSAGAPLAERPFEIVAEGARWAFGPRVRTDAEGRFRIGLSPRQIGIALPALRVQVIGDPGSETLAAPIERAEEIDAGDNDLGDLALSVAAPLLTGRVVGTDEDVRLLCQARDADGGWELVSGISARRDAGGAFELHGVAPPAPLRLVVFASDTAPVAPIPFSPGQRDLEVTLTQGGSIVVDAIVGDQRAFMVLAPRAVPVDGRAAEELLAMADPATRGMREMDRAVPAPEFVGADPATLRYTWRGLPAGRYRVEIRARQTGPAAHEIADVVVTAGEKTVLEAIDLRERLRCVTLRFPDLAGGVRETPATHGLPSRGHLFVLGADGSAGECTSIDGDFEFLAVTEPIDVLVDAPGFRRKILHGVHDDLEVQLEPGLPVALVLAAPVDVPAGAQLVVALTPGEGAALPSGAVVRSRAAGGSIPRYRPPTVPCRRDGETFHAAVTAPGTYGLSAELRAPSGRSEPLRVTPAQLVVPADGARATISLTR